MAMTNPKGKTTLSEINVTPLVDVMLVLLIIFMVTAPMIEQGADVNLPNTETVELESDEGKNVLIINKEGKIFLGKSEIPLEKLEESLKNNPKIQQDKEVYLQADEDLKYRLVARVLVILRKAGVKELGMVTEPLETENSPK